MLCRLDFITAQSADGIHGDSHQILLVSKSREMTSEQASHVGAFSHGIGRFYLLVRKGRVRRFQPIRFDGKVATGTAEESSP